MKSRLIFLVVFFVISVLMCASTSFSILAEPSQSLSDYTDFSTSAKSMVLIEKDTGRVLEKKNENEKLALASLTKIVTALCVIENTKDFDKKFVVSDKAIGVSGTSIYLKKGEKKSVQELLYGLMLRSGNDAAVALAIETGKTIENFSKMMNETAIKYGAENSCFLNPHGLDQKGHHSTALDIGRISIGAMKNDRFRSIVSTKFAEISGYDEGTHRILQNKNRLLSTFDLATGIKTGFTDDAGRCFVGSAEKDNMELVCVVLNCGPMFEDAKQILENGFKKYKLFSLLQPYNVVEDVPVVNGEFDSVKVISFRGFSYPLSVSEYLKIDYQYELPESLKAPLKKEQIVGGVKILLGNDLLFSENIYTMEEIRSYKMPNGLRKIIDGWL